MNAGDLGSCLAVCACAYDPIHVTAQGKKPGLNCACVPLVPRFYAVWSIKLCEECGSTSCVCVFFSPWGHVNWMPKYGHMKRHHGHMGSMLDADWFPKILLRSDWLLRLIASYTTAPIHECESEIDHYTGHYEPYSLRRVCGFFNVPQIYCMCKGL